MEKLLVIVLVLVVSVVVNGREQRHHPKFPETKRAETCSRTHEINRNRIIDEAMCGVPKDVFVEMQPMAAHLQVMPGAVWVKRCVGLCSEPRASCIALDKRIRQIPVRIYDAKTGKENCSWYPIEEHTKCGCCTSSPDKCQSPRVFDPRKCSCQCPNVAEERRKCPKRSPNMRWNRSKCVCEPRHRPSRTHSDGSS